MNLSSGSGKSTLLATIFQYIYICVYIYIYIYIILICYLRFPVEWLFWAIVTSVFFLAINQKEINTFKTSDIFAAEWSYVYFLHHQLFGLFSTWTTMLTLKSWINIWWLVSRHVAWIWPILVVTLSTPESLGSYTGCLSSFLSTKSHYQERIWTTHSLWG